MDTLYTAHATAVGGRNGHAETDDGRLSVSLSHPVAPNRPSTGTDPEQLFACGYAACFGGAVEFVAKQDGYALAAPARVASTVVLLKRPEGGFTISVDLDVTLTGVDTPTAEALVAKAHQVCPYSNATRGNVQVSLRATGLQTTA